MRSTSSETASNDRTTQARIRDAAISRFAEDGPAATVRAIAAEAGVSPGLVIHHYGTMSDLRKACDRHVAATIRDRKTRAMAAGTGLDPLAALREDTGGAPIMRYLARTLVDGSTEVAALVDEMVADATTYMEQGVASGILNPTEHAEERAAVLTLWSLGALVLHEHARRILGVELVGSAENLAETGTAYFRGATDILSRGVISPAMAERLADAFAMDPTATTSEERS